MNVELSAELFVLGLGAGLLVLLQWAFRVLPRERWQVLAAVPVQRRGEGVWNGVNLTYYGLFTALGLTLALALVVVLIGALGVSRWRIAALMAAVLGLALPAARLVARWVERKSATLTIGGAGFVGMVAAPLVVLALNLACGGDGQLPLVPVMAALAVAYLLGEGLGRLACISFGCCYGKPLDQLPPGLRRWLAPAAMTFEGETKKIAYASGLSGVRVVPIQAITCTLYVLSALAGTWLYLHGRFATAFVLAVVVAQGWRLLSETLRADYRGGGTISAYQWMAGAAMVYALAVQGAAPAFASAGAPAVVVAADLGQGLAALWHPAVILLLQLAGLAVFLFTGWSQVTGSLLAIHVHRHKI